MAIITYEIKLDGWQNHCNTFTNKQKLHKSAFSYLIVLSIKEKELEVGEERENFLSSIIRFHKDPTKIKLSSGVGF